MIDLVERERGRMEIGSEFSWSGLLDGPRTPWPPHHRWFALGRDAVAAIATSVPTSRVWVPTFFCPEVVSAWRSCNLRIVQYADSPLQPFPIWQSLQTQPGDLVVAVNYFGIREGQAWQEWHNDHPDVTLIEDHTHDPGSSWASNSTADYGFASLRKTIPVPDGALLWSPRGHALPEEPSHHDFTGSALKLAGMLWKREYLLAESCDESLRETYREFEIGGERELNMRCGQRIAPWSRSLLRPGLPQLLRQRRLRNVVRFIRQFRERLASERCDLLFDLWPAGHCPLNPVLHCVTAEVREQIRRRLIAQRIFTPVHWTIPPGADGESEHAARGLSTRLLTIPLDFRCSESDVDHVVDCMEEERQWNS